MEIPLSSRDQVNQYIRKNFTAVPDKVLEYEEIAANMPIPPHHISPELGKLLMILVKSIKAKSVLEIGTMWGFSTWWLWQGLNEQGKIITLDKDLKHCNLAKQFLADMKMQEQVELRQVDALEELKNFENNQFDFIFLDADKKEYCRFYDLFKDLLQPGGMLVVDNAIFSSAWDDKTVADHTNKISIQKTQEFNKIISNSQEFTAVPVAVNSGILLALKV